jgi:peptide/nickel transport system permease protein
MRLLRSGMLEALDSEFVKFARIKGIAEGKVIWVHALRNALVPWFTYSAIVLATLITGGVTVEVVFNWPGIGRLAYQAIIGRDFPLVQGIVLFAATLVVVVNLMVDLLYAYIDPRIRLAE